ncbi:MAG TPA: hypothetical protein VJ729_10650 [Nitrososphaeraceae archaeon]|nr:hypothetical protein [Nitrososphaeraceae archaeon]
MGGGSNGDGGGDKPKTSAYKEDEGSGNHLVAPGSPVEVAKDKHKQQNNDGSNGGLIAPGVPVPPAANGGGDNSGWGYNNGNIKNFDTSKSSFRIGGSDGKIVQYKPGFNETFYNSTLPYCFAVQSGSCYNSATGQITP